MTAPALSCRGAEENCFDTLDVTAMGDVDGIDMDRAQKPSSQTAGCAVTASSASPSEGCDDGNTMSGDGCSATCESEVDVSGLETSWSYDGRQVYVWKFGLLGRALSDYNSFCEDRGLNWFTPIRAGDAPEHHHHAR